MTLLRFSLERTAIRNTTARRPAPSPKRIQRAHRRSWWIVGLLTAAYLTWLLFHWQIATPLFFHPLVPQAVRDVVYLLELATALTLFFVWVLMVVQYRRRPQPANPASEPVAPLTHLTLDDLYELSPKAFEHYVAALFRRKGYRVNVSGRSGDEGVDLEIIQPNGKRAIAQCKRYRNTVGPDVVRELFGTMIHERVHHAFLVTTAPISEGAYEWAKDKPMTLIDGQSLARLVAAATKR